MKKNTIIYSVATIVSVAGFIFGMDTALIGATQMFIFKTFNLVGEDLFTNGLKGFIVASVPMGALLGAIIGRNWAMQFGRRGSLLYASMFFLIGVGVIIGSWAVWMLVIGRLIFGFGVGLSIMVGPMYLGEVTPAEKRGTIVFCFQLAINLGLLFSFLLGYGISFIHLSYEVEWRLLYGIMLGLVVVLFLGLRNIPESPRWLVLKNQEDKAKAVLRTLLQKQDVEDEILNIKNVSPNGNGAGVTKNIFHQPLIGLMLVGILIYAFQQLTGINGIIYYSSEIFKSSGFTGTACLLAQVALGVVNVLATFFGVFVVDKLGRRFLLCLGFIGMATALTLLASVLNQYIFTQYTELLSLGLILVFIVFFALSIGGLSFVLTAEIFPLDVRAVGMAIASISAWVFNFIVSQSFGILNSTIGIGNTFYIYAFFTICGFIFVYYFIPETKNRSLEEIEKNLYSGKRFRDLGDC